MNSKHGASIKTELEPETFKPNLREASDLLEADQIEKVQTVVHTCSDAACVGRNVYPTLKDKVGDAVLYVMLSKSHEETKTNNELILLTSPDLSSYSRHTVAVSWTQSYAHHFYVVDTFCCI